MIATIKGRISEIKEDNIIIEVGSIGLQVYIPSSSINKLQTGDDIFVFTFLVVREDALTLYGFKTKDEKQLFGLLISVNGVGPRLSLAILSSLSTDSIRSAIINEQYEIFSRVPGIGKKTAQKILLQLQDKIPATYDLVGVSEFTDVDNDVVAALNSLGYSIVEAQSAVQSISKDTPQDVELRLRLALQYLGS
jgi:Holliday junction DNA helicase RuvA